MTESLKMPNCGLCAHRGAMVTHPENTLAAFREAIRIGAHEIEFDVCRTKDDQLVIIHDPTVDRISNGTGKIAELTLDDIQKMDAGSWKYPQFKGERIPTLSETLSIMPENIWLNVHLKGGRKLGEKVARVIAGENRLHQAFLACEIEAAKGAKTAVPDILICNMERQGDSWEYIDLTIKTKADFIQIYNSVPDDLPEKTKKLKEHNVRINYCCTDDPAVLKRLFAEGVDFILVNDIASMMKIAREIGIRPLTPVFREY